MNDRPKKVIIFIGPPGSGKDTQADMLAEDFEFYHIQSSRIIEKKFEEADPNDPIMQEEKNKFKEGKLTKPELVLGWIIEEIRKAKRENNDLVFSGSARTVPEVEGELPVLEELYGKENVYVINIEASEDESIKRNSTRRICKGNRHPIPNLPEFENLKTCPKDGSEIITRTLDKPEIIKVRYQTYLEETKPVLDIFKRRGYTVIPINGEQSIRNVHKDVLTAIDAYGHTELLEKFGE